MEIEIRYLKEGEEAAVNELYNLSYHQQRSIEKFRWEFFNGPAGKAIYVVAVDKEKNKIVGTQCAIPIEFISGAGEKVLTAKSEDTLLDPGYRGMGLFDKMYKLLFKACEDAGIKYIWGFTYARKPFLKTGFEIPFAAVQGICVLKPYRSYQYLSKLNSANKNWDKFKILGLSYTSFFKSLLNPSVRGKNETDIKENIQSGRQAFIQSAMRDEKVKYWSICFSASYLNWRIYTNPYKNQYQILTAFEKDQPVADLITNRSQEGLAYLEQLIFDKELAMKKRKELVGKLMNQLESENIFLVRYWGFLQNEINAAEITLLKQCGFTFLNKGTSFVWKNLESVSGPDINPAGLVLSRLFTQGNSIR